MKAKGSSRSECCCSGCSRPPFDGRSGEGIPNSGGIEHVDLLQQFCCACIPRQICVGYECGYESVTAAFDLLQPCSQNDIESVYRGVLQINGQGVDIDIFFRVVDEECYLCLKSYLLGRTGDESDACILLDDEKRRTLCPTLGECPEDEPYEPILFEWIFSPAMCAEETARLTIGPASLTSLNPLIPRNPDCPDNCDGELDPIDPYEECDRCGYLCTGCGCICSTACITVTRAGSLHTNEMVGLCGRSGVYRTSTGFAISIVSNYETECCELELTEIPPDIVPLNGALPPNVPIGGINNPCPSPTAQWLFFDANAADELINGVFVRFECATCRTCPPREDPPGGCCNPQYVPPTTLFASIPGTDLGCVCAENVIELTWSPNTPNLLGTTIGVWIGTGAFCSHEIELRLYCGEWPSKPEWDGWRLDVQWPDRCVEATPMLFAPNSLECNPLELVFGPYTPGPPCCDNTDPLNPPTGFEITITE